MFGPQHVVVGIGYMHIGSTEQVDSRFLEAKKHYENAMLIFENTRFYEGQEWARRSIIRCDAKSTHLVPETKEAYINFCINQMGEEDMLSRTASRLQSSDWKKIYAMY